MILSENRFPLFGIMLLRRPFVFIATDVLRWAILLSLGTSRQFGIESAEVKLSRLLGSPAAETTISMASWRLFGTQANGPTRISAEEHGGTSAAARRAVRIGCQPAGKLSFADAGA